VIEQKDNISFLGCPVSRLSIPQTLEWIADAVRSGKPRQISVVNANKYHLMSRDHHLYDIIRNSDLVIPEWAVVWGARQLKLPTLPHSGGILLARQLLPFAAQRKIRIYFLGAKPDVVSRLAQKVVNEYPGLEIAGHHHGYLTTPTIEAQAINEIRQARPDVLLVGFGSPRQEKWIAANKDLLNVPVSIGVGGSFDVLSGAKPDTPDWARGRGLEWLYRIMQDPKAYTKRYLVSNIWFVWQIFKEKAARILPG
jgi:N-acetylglucosaminyldiphosphoundecaprenol N-acetyl-beta-D-mannosaminyltransferase